MLISLTQLYNCFCVLFQFYFTCERRITLKMLVNGCLKFNKTLKRKMLISRVSEHLPDSV